MVQGNLNTIDASDSDIAILSIIGNRNQTGLCLYIANHNLTSQQVVNCGHINDLSITTNSDHVSRTLFITASRSKVNRNVTTLVLIGNGHNKH